ncbi:Protein P, partial [Varanus komodoensis]
MAPRVFIKCMAPVCAFLRLQGIQIYPYLDDWLLVFQSREGLLASIRTTCALLDDLSLRINAEKSSLLPTQTITFIGARLDSTLEKAFLPQDRQQTLACHIHQMRRDGTVPAKSIQRILGHMASAVAVVPHVRLRLRLLQLLFNKMFHPQRDPLSKLIRIPSSVLHSLLWWSVPANLTVGVPFRARCPSITLSTGTSLLGWGVICFRLYTQGMWNRRESTNHINFLELLAVFKALRSFEDILQHRVVQITSDNVATVFYLNKQGGTKSPTLARLSMKIWDWCIPRDITLMAVRLAGVDNVQADLLSRHMFISHEWELDPHTRDHLFLRWSSPDVDLFATQQNKKWIGTMMETESWIGLLQAGTSWKWSGGGEHLDPSKYKWLWDFPATANGCALMMRGGKLRAISCTEQHFYICEKEIAGLDLFIDYPGKIMLAVHPLAVYKDLDEARFHCVLNMNCTGISSWPKEHFLVIGMEMVTGSAHHIFRLKTSCLPGRHGYACAETCPTCRGSARCNMLTGFCDEKSTCLNQQSLETCSETSVSERCPDMIKWRYWNRHCYYFLSYFGTWKEANTSCSRFRAAELLWIENEADLKWLRYFVEEPLWLGLQDLNKDNIWTWSHGDDATTALK